MGNTLSINNESIDKNICINLSPCINLDKNDQMIKQYIIYYKRYGYYKLLIKNINNNKLFVYIDDKLIHIVNNVKYTYPLKYVQITSDFTLLSLPIDKIYVYDLLSLIQKKEICIMYSFHTKINNNIYKTILFDTSYWIIDSKNISIYEKNGNVMTNMYNIDNYNRFCKSSKCMISLDNNKLTYYDFHKQKNIAINIQYQFHTNTLNVFNHKLFFVDIDNNFIIYEILQDKYHILKNIHGYSNLNIINYDKLSSMIDENNIFTVVYALSNDYNKIIYWIINNNEGKFTMSCDYTIDINLSDEIKYIYSKDHITILQSNDNVITCDINKIISIKIIELLATNEKQIIQNNKNDNIHNYISILATDETIQEYKLNNFMKEIISLHAESDNIFFIRHNANLRILDSNSFTIFQQLLTDNQYQSIILLKIFSIKEYVSRHNTVIELLDHMYDYTKTIILNPNSKNTSLHDKKALYVCYSIMTFIIRYYELSYMKENKTRDIKYDIINTFIDNFPLFSDFMTNNM